MRGQVSLWIDADPQQVWEIVSDVTRIGELSPETFEAMWTHGATGPAVGARFKGHVKRNGVGPTYWTTCTVTSCVAGEDFGFGVYAGKTKVNNWRYQLTKENGGTRITESFELETSGFSKVYWKLLGWHRGKANERGMTQTLERVRTIAEQS